MRRMQTHGLARALEQEAIIAPTDVVPGDESAELNAAESLETELLEVNDGAAEGDIQEAQVDNAVEAADELEDLAASLESICGQGGLDRNGAMMMEKAIETLCVKAGVSSRTASRPSMESYGGSQTRVRSTQLALEDVKGKIKEIWEAIIANLKRVYEWCVNFFMKIFGGAEKLKKRAEAVLAKGESLTGTAKESSIENAGLVKKLHISGKMPNAATVTGEFKTDMESIMKTAVPDLITAGEAMLAAAEDPVKMAESFVARPTAPPKFSEVGEAQGFSAPQGMKVYRSEEMPGGLAGIAIVPGSEIKGVEGINLAAKTSMRIDKFDPKAKEPTLTKVAVMSANDIQTVAKNISSLADDMIAFRKESKKVEEAMKKATNAANKAAGKLANDEDAEKKKAAEAVKRLFGSLPKIFTAPIASSTTTMLNISKSFLDWCELSIKQYGAAK